MAKSIPDSFPAGITSGSPERDQQLYIDFVAKYQGDPAYRAWVERGPVGALRAEGLQVPDGVEVTRLAGADEAMHSVLPTRADE